MASSSSAWLRNEVVRVWALLVALTALSWWLGAGHGAAVARVATTVVLLVAFAKVALIGRTFMELRHAALVLRVLFYGLTSCAAAVLVGVYLLD